MSADQLGSATVAALPSSEARTIAFHGRQKSKWYLSLHVLIAASAAARFCIARRRALSATSRWFRVMSWRAKSFQLATGVLFDHLAVFVCSSVREEPVALPSALTSVESAAQAALLSAGGPALRDCDELCRRNGFTPPAHGVGSLAWPGSSDQCPGALLGTH